MSDMKSIEGSSENDTVAIDVISSVGPKVSIRHDTPSFRRTFSLPVFVFGVMVGAAALVAGLSIGGGSSLSTARFTWVSASTITDGASGSGNNDYPLGAENNSADSDGRVIFGDSPSSESDPVSIIHGVVDRWNALRADGPIDIETAIRFLDAGLSSTDPYGGSVSSDFITSLSGLSGPETAPPQSGLGLYFDRSGSFLTVAGVSPGSAGEAAGIRPGARILSINGLSLDKEFSYALSVFSSAVSAASKKGDSVDLEVAGLLHGKSFYDGVSHIFVVPSLWYDSTAFVTEFRSSPHPVAMIRWRSITSASAMDLARAMDQATLFLGVEPKGIVVLMDENTGGLTSEALDALALFVPSGTPAFSRITRSGREDLLVPQRSLRPYNGSVVIVVGQDTASAAEIFVGALRHAKRVLVVGENTRGKSTIQRVVRLGDFGGVKFTTGRYLLPSEENIEGYGIKPDISLFPESPERRVDALFNIIDRLEESKN